MKKHNNTQPAISQTAVVHKSLGQTPLQCLEQYRSLYPHLEKIPMAYAGRLDPMAQGKLLLTIGESCKQRSRYLGLDKEYIFEVLLGWSSDSHDILGIPIPQRLPQTGIDEQSLQTIARSLVGRHTMPYPAFSSKTVDGKPLFLWALEGTIDTIDIPTTSVQIYRCDYMGSRIIAATELEQQIIDNISTITHDSDPRKSIGNDFRRDEILQHWNKHLHASDCVPQYTIAQFRCICSSGTYMRSLADMIGTQLHTKGLAWSITRTVIGKYLAWGRWGIWLKKY